MANCFVGSVTPCCAQPAQNSNAQQLGNVMLPDLSNTLCVGPKNATQIASAAAKLNTRLLCTGKAKLGSLHCLVFF